jgi:copper transport protein
VRTGYLIHARLGRVYLAAALAVLAALLARGVVLAHARLLRSNPEEGAVLAEAPPQVYLWFDEPVAVEFSSVRLLDANAQPVGAAALRNDPSDPTLLIAALPGLSSGVYTLYWKVLSNTDSHFTQGTLVFGVGQAVGAAAPRPVAAQVSIPPAEAALRTLNYATLALLIGSLIVARVILRPEAFGASARDTVNAARRRLNTLGLGAAALALIVGFGWLAWQVAVLGYGTWSGLPGTRFGVLWLARQISALTVFMALIAARRGWRGAWPGAGLAIAALAIIQALGGHAAGLPRQTALAVAADALHLLAAGAWVGSLFALLVALLPLLWSNWDEAKAVALGGWGRFGIVAVVSVGGVAATGLYNAARQVASVDAWISTLYGQVLAGKVLLFLMVGLAGLTNSMLLHPRLAAIIGAALRRPRGWTPLRRERLPIILLAEAGLAAVILVASSLLTAAPPARGPEFEPPRAVVKPPSSLTLPADDLLVTLAIRPNKPGLNILSVDVLNTRRPAPAEILRVLVRLTYLEEDLGTQTVILDSEDSETYRLSTSLLSLPGAWRAQVAVRRYGLEDSVADFDWQVESLAPAAPPRPVILSNAPLGPALTVLAVGLAIGAVFAGVWLKLSMHPFAASEAVASAANESQPSWIDPSN